MSAVQSSNCQQNTNLYQRNKAGTVSIKQERVSAVDNSHCVNRILTISAVHSKLCQKTVTLSSVDRKYVNNTTV